MKTFQPTSHQRNQRRTVQSDRGVASVSIRGILELVVKMRRSESVSVVLYVRASHPSQEKNGNLKEAVDDALQMLRRMGCRVVEYFSEVAHSSIYSPRPALDAAISCARKHNAVLVAPSRDRFLRHQFFDKTNDTERPTSSEYRDLAGLAEGVVLATIQAPDAPARHVQIKRGQKAKGTPIGRKKESFAGWSNRRRGELLPWVQEWRKQGRSYGWMQKRLRTDGFPAPTKMTLWNWINSGEKPV